MGRTKDYSKMTMDQRMKYVRSCQKKKKNAKKGKKVTKRVGKSAYKGAYKGARKGVKTAFKKHAVALRHRKKKHITRRRASSCFPCGPRASSCSPRGMFGGRGGGGMFGSDLMNVLAAQKMMELAKPPRSG